jgi:hypothetical protein
MSPELETLDQLLGGDLPVSVIRDLFGDERQFARSVTAMLNAGELRLLTGDGEEVPRWQWREILNANALGARLRITQAGARRIA